MIDVCCTSKLMSPSAFILFAIRCRDVFKAQDIAVWHTVLFE